jgi:transcriptional regulator with XRE-family HTH domain
MKDLADKLGLMSGACASSGTAIRTGMLLRQVREQAGITQREFAERLGSSQPAISQAEAGGVNLCVATLQRFADALGCDLQLAIVRRETMLKHGASAAFRRSQLKAQEKQWSGS